MRRSCFWSCVILLGLLSPLGADEPPVATALDVLSNGSYVRWHVGFGTSQPADGWQAVDFDDVDSPRSKAVHGLARRLAKLRSEDLNPCTVHSFTPSAPGMEGPEGFRESRWPFASPELTQSFERGR